MNKLTEASRCSWCLALYMWIVPQWVKWRIDWNGRAHPYRVDGYGRPAGRLAISGKADSGSNSTHNEGSK